MKIIIQKFGGTSVSTEENRKNCLNHIKNSINEGYKVVCVVSAMGRKGDPYSTDTLLSLINNELEKKDIDLLLSTGEIISANVFNNLLINENIDSCVFTGGEAGILTDDNYNNAKIISLKPEKLLKELEKRDVIVVTGFQGITEDGNVTTLGRGGSDTSATALGAALDAEFVDIFTDVEGIMTADPRIVSNASLIDVVSYNEICNLAYLGAKVIHPRAVEIAMQKNIPIRVKSTFSNSEGTLVTNVTEINNSKLKDRLITGITSNSNITQLSIKTDINNLEINKKVFELMDKLKVSVDFISISKESTKFTINNDKFELVKKELFENEIEFNFVENCSKVSLVGGGIAGVPGVVNKIISTLANEKIEILQSADSHTTIWVLVKDKDLNKSILSLHNKFEL